MAECLSTKTYSCGKCECNLTNAHETERETIRVYDFLFGLDEVHSFVRSQICAQIPLPDLDMVYQTIVQNKIVQLNAKTDTPSVLSFSAQTDNRPSSTPRQNNSYRPRPPNPDANATCTSCRRLGHRATSCFRVLNFPEWWGTRPRNRTNYQGGQGVAQPTEQNTAARANTSQLVNSKNEIADNLTLTDNDRQGLTGFSDSQWQTLVKLLNPTKPTTDGDRLSGKNNDPVWILDTGATHHMTGRLDLLHDTHLVSPISVKLPAGDNVLTTKRGTIRLTS